jgi:riboflavin synthase
LGDGEGRTLTLRLPPEFLRYCVYKGSLTLGGVSLTIAAVEGDTVRIAVIPHTLTATVLGRVKAGDKLNFEADILAKYVERITGAGNAQEIPLNDDALRKWGYAVS